MSPDRSKNHAILISAKWSCWSGPPWCDWFAPSQNRQAVIRVFIEARGLTMIQVRVRACEQNVSAI